MIESHDFDEDQPIPKWREEFDKIYITRNVVGGPN